MTSPTINDMMSAYAEDAIDFAKRQFGATLDYSHESIELVESMADKLFQSKPKSVLSKLIRRGPSDEEVQTICKMFGGYIGEVLRRSKGGDWAINQEYSAIGVQCGETWFFPPAKVHKRLTNGAEDDLGSYFRVLLDQPWSR